MSDQHDELDLRPIRGDKGMVDGARGRMNETARRLHEKVLYTMSCTPSADFDAFEFTSLRDYVLVAQWWAAQSNTSALALEEENSHEMAYRIDLGDGGVLMRASDDIVRALLETNPDAFGGGAFRAGGPIDIQAALRRMGEIEESAKTAAPRRKA